MSLPDYTPIDAAERALWAFMTRHQRFTMADLKASVTCSDYKVEKFTAKLRRKNILLPCRRDGATQLFTVMDTAAALSFGKAKRETKSGMMWAVMRTLRTFTPREVLLGMGGEETITLADAEKYCTHLLQAQYLRVVEKAKPDIGRPARYRLVKDTGALPPVRKQRAVLIDPNEDRGGWVSGALL